MTIPEPASLSPTGLQRRKQMLSELQGVLAKRRRQRYRNRSMAIVAACVTTVLIAVVVSRTHSHIYGITARNKPLLIQQQSRDLQAIVQTDDSQRDDSLLAQAPVVVEPLLEFSFIDDDELKQQFREGMGINVSIATVDGQKMVISEQGDILGESF